MGFVIRDPVRRAALGAKTETTGDDKEQRTDAMNGQDVHAYSEENDLSQQLNGCVCIVGVVIVMIALVTIVVITISSC